MTAFPPSLATAPTAHGAWPPLSGWSLALAAELAGQDAHGALRAALRHLLARTGACRAAWAWYEQGHAQVAMTARAEPSEGADADIVHFEPGDALPGGVAAVLAAALEEAVDQAVVLTSVEPALPVPEWVTRAQQAWADHHGEITMTVPLPGADSPWGAVSLSWRRPAAGGAAAGATGYAAHPAIDLLHEPPPPDLLAPGALRDALVQDIHAVAAVLALQRRASRPWHWHARHALRQRAQRWKAATPARRRRWLAGAAVAVAVLALWPLPRHVGGQARLEGAQQRVLAAPTDGYIKAAHAQPGDRVRAGQVLADLAEQDLRLERDKWTSQVAQQDNAYAAAMTRADRAEAALSLSRLEEAQAQLALVDEQLRRSQLKAPFDGVLIQGDLSQSIGAPVKQGDALMTVASTVRFRVIVEVDESDVASVRVGQAGAMALSALPWDTLGLRVERITPLGIAKDGRNVFEVQAALTQAVPPQVRPGLTGRAQLVVGRQPLAWSLLGPLVDRLRLLWWSL